VVYLFGREESKAKNSKVAQEYVDHRELGELYWFGPPESNTLRPVVGVDCLRIGRGEYKGRLVHLILASRRGRSQTLGRLRPGDLSLRYTSCHIPLICFGQSPPRSLSCTPSLEVVMD
jgi:hypothetical protein